MHQERPTLTSTARSGRLNVMISPLGRADGTLATSYKVVSHVPEANHESAPVETFAPHFLGQDD